MRHVSVPFLLTRLALLAAFSLVLPGPAWADAPTVVEVTIKDHRFTPAELRVPAGRPILLHVRNEDPTAEEFESRPLKIEKVIPGGKTGTVRIRALGKGRYPFVGEFHEATATGVLVAE